MLSDSTASASDWIVSALERYERPLIAYAARLLGDVERARDVVQDTFLKLWQADRAALEGHLAPWLFTVCRNRALDELRKDGRMTALSDGQSAVSDPGPSPEGTGEERGEQVSRILQLLDGLSPRQQEVVRLKFQGGLSYRQISEVMDLTVSHVGVLIHTALKTVRQQMEVTSGAG